MRAGASGAFEVLWDRNPDLILSFFAPLRRGTAFLVKTLGRYLYRLVIARDLPHFVACTRESLV
jgi:hypothetical protein